jgi:hypothetical protein
MSQASRKRTLMDEIERHFDFYEGIIVFASNVKTLLMSFRRLRPCKISFVPYIHQRHGK